MHVSPTTESAYRLVNIRRTAPKSYEELRLIVLVLDENGYPITGVKVAFSYSTANQFLVDTSWVWTPPHPFRADIVPTSGGGQIEHIQGSTVKEGEPGGITVYVADPTMASDVVTGAGALADHTGMYFTFQRKIPGVLSLADRVARLEDEVFN